jgi:hypothetical protein
MIWKKKEKSYEENSRSFLIMKQKLSKKADTFIKSIINAKQKIMSMEKTI